MYIYLQTKILTDVDVYQKIMYLEFELNNQLNGWIFDMILLIDGVNLLKPQLYTIKTTTESDNFH